MMNTIDNSSVEASIPSIIRQLIENVMLAGVIGDVLIESATIQSTEKLRSPTDTNHGNAMLRRLAPLINLEFIPMGIEIGIVVSGLPIDCRADILATREDH
jgi:hypothetical protein